MYMEYSGLNQNFEQYKRKINVEASTRCNLLCPGCSRTKDILGLENRTKTWDIGDLDIENFKLLVREENKLKSLTYNLALSDPIYSGTLFSQLEYINTLSWRPNIVVSTNGSGRSEKWWKQFASLLRGHQDRIEFAVDGLADTNHIYRVNAKWDSIVIGIKTLRENFNGPIWWRYIVFEHNYHQINEAKALAKEWGVSNFQVMLGDDRTPDYMQLKSATWDDVLNDIS